MSRRVPARLIVVIGALVCATAAIAAIAPADRPERADLVLSRARQALRIENSRAGRAIVTGSRLAPGRTGHGKVTVEVSAPAKVGLSLGKLNLAPGPNGAFLASSLVMQIKEVGAPGKRIIYDGPLGGLETASLGRWMPGERHQFRIRVTFARTPQPQDALQDAQTSFRLTWRASA